MSDPIARDMAFYVVWQPESGPPTMRHTTPQVAEDEARRLASANPGKEFFVLMTTKSFKRQDPVVVTIFDDIPF